MYVVGGSGYLPGFDQQLTDSTAMQSNFECEQEKSIERVHQWIAQQHKFAGVPPPEEEASALFRSQGTVDITNNKDISLTSDPPFIDRLPLYRSEEHIQPAHSNTDLLKFSGLELNRFYSPDLTRRRRYIPHSDPSLNAIQHGVNNRNSLILLGAGQNNGDARGSPIPCPAIGHYFCHSGEGNTFPRRRKLNDKTRQRNLFSLSTGGQHQGNTKLYSYNETVIANPCPSHHSNSESIHQVVEDQPIPLSGSRSFLYNAVNVGVTEEVNSLDKNSELNGNLPLGTQHLFSCNLIGANAIHKLELSDILPKYKMGKKCGYNHVRMYSAPEVTYLNDCDIQKKIKESKRTTCEIRKVKAFSWPKRAVLPSYTCPIKDELAKSNTPIKTESGYNTEKSEDKNDVVIVDNEKFNECIDRNSSTEVSDQSDLPPARPPLPSQKSYCDTNLPSHDVHLKSPSISEHHSNIGNVASGKTADTFHQYTGIKYLRGKENNNDFGASGFCSSTDLTRNVSMSLKDLIRIHEQEIARVSGVRSSRLKGIDVMHDKPHKTYAADSKGRNKSIWKRHTTIGLLTNFNNVEKQKDIVGHSFDKSVHPNFPDNEGDSLSEKSIVVYHKPISTDNASSLCSPPHSCAKRGMKKSGPLTLPKPPRESLNSSVNIEPSVVGVVRHKNTDMKNQNNLTSVKHPSYVDACIQTDLVLLNLGEYENNCTLMLANEKKEMKNKFEKEKQIMHKKLEEQKKVANAYQKLEDRYRRKVYDLQKALHMCTCSKGNAAVKAGIRLFPDVSYSNSTVLFQDNHDISVNKVDSILHQLEAWLNNQTNGIHTDTSEFSSIIGSTNGEPFPRYRLTTEHYTSPPLEIIDQIDATSV